MENDNNSTNTPQPVTPEPPKAAPMAVPPPIPQAVAPVVPSEPEKKKPKKKSKAKIIVPSVIIGLITLAGLFFYFISPVTVPFLCNHSFAAATCTVGPKCERCGKVDGKPKDHKWIEATCTDAKTCKKCKATEGQPIPHSIIPATCTEPAYCTMCNAEFESAKEHNWVDATCTQPITCTNCGAVQGSATGHDWKEANCDRARHCAICGEKDGEPLGHEMVNDKCIRCNHSSMTPDKAKGYVLVTGFYWESNSSNVIAHLTIQNPSSSRYITGFSYDVTFFDANDKTLTGDNGKTRTTYELNNLYLGYNNSYSHDCYLDIHYSQNPDLFRFDKITVYFSDGTSTILDGTNNTNAVLTWR